MQKVKSENILTILLGRSKLLKDPHNHSTSVCQFKSQWFLNFSIVEKDVGAAETRHKMLLDTSVTETMKPSLPKLLQFQVPRKLVQIIMILESSC